VSPRIALHDDIPTVRSGNPAEKGNGGAASSEAAAGKAGPVRDSSDQHPTDKHPTDNNPTDKKPTDKNPTDSVRVLPDLGPSLIDGRVLLALLHSADPVECPYDPTAEDPQKVPPKHLLESSSLHLVFRVGALAR
jgi:hypothetical protein